MRYIDTYLVYDVSYSPGVSCVHQERSNPREDEGQQDSRNPRSRRRFCVRRLFFDYNSVECFWKLIRLSMNSAPPEPM